MEDNLDKEDEPMHVVDHNDHVQTQASDFLDVEDKSKPLQSFASTSEGIDIQEAKNFSTEPSPQASFGGVAQPASLSTKGL